LFEFDKFERSNFRLLIRLDGCEKEERSAAYPAGLSEIRTELSFSGSGKFSGPGREVEQDPDFETGFIRRQRSVEIRTIEGGEIRTKMPLKWV